MQSSVQPLFVFDGPNKPPFKRNKKTSRHGGSISDGMTKQLLKLFGFPFHSAPGEAEAECAYLQREGIVDAVLSEDVDTLMFGCGQTLRKWCGVAPKSKETTHVSVYNAKATKEGESGLDREGMILVALMSGGDYITEGIPGAGIKVACEAARAGYGKRLCQLSRSDDAGLNAWREDLAHELRTNESKHFKMKRKALTIPENFPNKDVLGYYTHPVVSTPQKIEKLRTEIVWDGSIDVHALREFVGLTFEWTHKSGAKKFIRGLAPAMLVYKLRTRKDRRESYLGDITLTQMNELELVRDICGERKHISTDGELEIRLLYHPLEITGVNLDVEEDFEENEEYGRDGLAPQNEEGDIEVYTSDTNAEATANLSKRAAVQYDPTELDRAWVLSTIAKLGIPLKVEDYEAKKNAPKPKKATKAKTTKKKSGRGGMPEGALDRFIQVSKPGLLNKDSSAPISSQQDLPPVYLAPALEKLDTTKSIPNAIKPSQATRSSTRPSTNTVFSKRKSTMPRAKSKALPTQKRGPNMNPFALAQSPSSSSNIPVTKPNMQATKPKDRSPPPIFRQSFQVSSSPPTSLRSSPSPPHEHLHFASPQTSNVELELIELPDSVTISRRSKSRPHNIPGTPTRLLAKNSPRKKVTPDIVRARDGSPDIFMQTPVARKLDFGSAVNDERRASRGSSVESESDLPTLQEILTPRKKPKTTMTRQTPNSIRRDEVIDLSSSPPEMTHAQMKVPTKTISIEELEEEKPRRKFIVLRESLPGGWKEVDEDDLRDARGKGRRAGTVFAHSQVEILDLSGDA